MQPGNRAVWYRRVSPTNTIGIPVEFVRNHSAGWVIVRELENGGMEHRIKAHNLLNESDARRYCPGAADIAFGTCKTDAEILQLQQQWAADPSWDIETTAGFEAHRDMLRECRRQMEAQWAEERRERLLAKAEALGCPGNVKLAESWEMLEYRLEMMQHEIARLQGE